MAMKRVHLFSITLEISEKENILFNFIDLSFAIRNLYSLNGNFDKYLLYSRNTTI